MAYLGMEATLVSFSMADLLERPFDVRTCSEADQRKASTLQISPAPLTH
jgi:hypothetical protein